MMGLEMGFSVRHPASKKKGSSATRDHIHKMWMKRAVQLHSDAGMLICVQIKPFLS